MLVSDFLGSVGVDESSVVTYGDSGTTVGISVVVVAATKEKIAFDDDDNDDDDDDNENNRN